MRGIAVPVDRQIAVGHVVLEAPADCPPILVKARNREQVRDVHLVHECDGVVEQLSDVGKTFGVQRIGVVDVYGAGHASDEIVRVRVLAAEYRVDLHDLLLPLQGLKVMRHAEQVHLRRELVGRVPPVAVCEYAQLPALDERCDPPLDVGEVLGRALGPVGNALSDLGGFLRVGFQRAHHVHPVERVQVVEVDHVVLKVLRTEHEVSHELRVRRNGDPQRIFHCPYGRQGVHRGADTAGPFREGPGVPGVAPLEYPLEPPDHRS